MTEITDATSELVIPYLIHFSKAGIAPKILGVDGFAIRMRMAEGPRLFRFLRDADQKQLERVYGNIGRNVAYMHKYCVSHRDLHTGNIVVENGLPVIIDWGKASYGAGLIDSVQIMADTQERLAELTRRDLYKELERAFLAANDEERHKPLEVSHEEIQAAAFREFGFI